MLFKILKLQGVSLFVLVAANLSIRAQEGDPSQHLSSTTPSDTMEVRGKVVYIAQDAVFIDKGYKDGLSPGMVGHRVEDDRRRIRVVYVAKESASCQWDSLGGQPQVGEEFVFKVILQPELPSPPTLTDKRPEEESTSFRPYSHQPQPRQWKARVWGNFYYQNDWEKRKEGGPVSVISTARLSLRGELPNLSGLKWEARGRWRRWAEESSSKAFNLKGGESSGEVEQLQVEYFPPGSRWRVQAGRMFSTLVPSLGRTDGLAVGIREKAVQSAVLVGREAELRTSSPLASNRKWGIMTDVQPWSGSGKGYYRVQFGLCQTFQGESLYQEWWGLSHSLALPWGWLISQSGDWGRGRSFGDRGRKLVPQRWFHQLQIGTSGKISFTLASSTYFVQEWATGGGESGRSLSRKAISDYSVSVGWWSPSGMSLLLTPSWGEGDRERWSVYSYWRSPSLWEDRLWFSLRGNYYSHWWEKGYQPSATISYRLGFLPVEINGAWGMMGRRRVAAHSTEQQFWGRLGVEASWGRWATWEVVGEREGEGKSARNRLTFTLMGYF